MQAFKTISMRLRGVKADDDTDELVPNLQKIIYDYTNVDGKGGVALKFDEHNFKSTYQILLEISKVWDKIDDDKQAQLLEKIAGKHRANVLASVLNNSELLESAFNDAMDSEGSAMAELEKRMQSIESHVNQLKVAWTDLARHTLETDFVIGVVDSITNLIKLIDKVIQKFGAAQVAAMAFAGVFSIFNARKMALAAVTQEITAAGAAAAGAAGKVSILSLGFKGLSKAFLPLAVVSGVISAIDFLFESVDEKQQVVDDLVMSIEDLQTQYDDLRNKEALNKGEQEQLEYLKNEIELRKEILAIKERDVAQAKAEGHFNWGSMTRNARMTSLQYFGGQFSSDLEVGKNISSENSGFNQALNNFNLAKSKYEEQKQKIEELIAMQDNLNNSSKEYADIQRQLDKEYDILASKEENYANAQSKMADMVSDLTDIQKELQDAYDKALPSKKSEYEQALKNIDAALEEAKAAMLINEAMAHTEYEKTSEEVAFLTEKLEVLNDVSEKANEGHIWTQEEIDVLCEKYPELEKIFEKYSEEVEGGVKLQKGAMDELKTAINNVTKAQLEGQLSMTKTALENVKKRISIYTKEISALNKLSSAINGGTASGLASIGVKLAQGEKIDPKDMMASALMASPMGIAARAGLSTAEKEELKLQKQMKDIEDELAKFQTGSIGDYVSSASLKDKDKKSKKTTKPTNFFIDTDSVIADIETMDDEVLRAIQDTQTKVENAVLNGDNNIELDLQQNLVDYYSKQLEINKEMVHKLENEKAYWVNTLQTELNKDVLAAFDGQDLNQLTQRQLDSVVRNLEMAIDKAKVAENDALEQSLTREKEMLEQYGGAIVNVTEKIKEYNSEALEVQNALLEQNITLIARRLELFEREANEKRTLLDLEQILMDEESEEYGDYLKIEMQKYDLILESQKKTMEAINEYRAQGLLDTSDEITDLKDKWYDYESDRLNMIKDFRDKQKKLEEDYNKNKVSLEKSIQSTISSIYKDAVDKRKKELEKELSSYSDYIDEILKRIDRDDATKTFEEEQKEQTKIILEKEDEISKYRLAAADGDKSAAIKVKELEEEIAEERKNLAKLQYNREKDLRKDNLNDIKDKAEKETEKKKEELDKQYDYAVSRLDSMKDLVEMTNEEVEALLQEFFAQVGASAEGYSTKLDELIEKKKELAKISEQIAAIDSVMPTWSKEDSYPYSPNNPANNYTAPSQVGSDTGEKRNAQGMTEAEAKKAFQLEEQAYLHGLMEQNGGDAWRTGGDKDKGLTAWIMEERKKWKMAEDGAIQEEGYVPPEYMEEFKRKYGFYAGGQTQRTGWHWLDGEIGKPEEVLNSDDTKYWRRMVDIAPDFLKVMSGSITKNNISNPVAINVGSMITIQGNVDKGIIPQIKNAGNEIITALTDAMTRRTGR